MDSQALATRQSAEVGEYLGKPLEGAEGYSQADLKLPVWKIVQGTSRMEGAVKHVGEFYNTVTGEYRPDLDVAVLSWKHARSLFSGDPSDSKPECLSRDCVQGSRYGACRGCQFNAEVHQDLWQGDPKTTKRCSLGYSMTLISPDEGTPSLFTAMKTAVGAVKMLNTTLMLKKLPLFGVLCNFSTVTRQEPGKQWQELRITIKRVLTADEVEPLRELSQAIRSQNVEGVEEGEVEANGQATPPDHAPIGDAPEPEPIQATAKQMPF